ncbi:hypothetical protein EDB89DRAFT_1920661 [Lactarius sanguifluus]|nr:hypothetical protein EDB89DRAFT_1920661 [Lactarius sanguifluus]
MSITAEARSLAGPTPTPFTGDRAQAQRFIVEFLELDRRNRRHPLIIHPALRVRLALSYIHGPLTTSWRHTIRLGGPSASEDETIWDDYFDAFCTAWIDDPTPPVVIPCPPPPPVVATTRPTPVPAQTTAASLPTPLVTPAAPRVEKRQHDDVSDTEETRPSKRPRIATHAGPPRARPQLARRSVPLPRKFVYRQRRATSAPVTSAPSFMVPHSPPPRRPPSPPDVPVHAPPLVDPDPRPLAPIRTVVEDDNTLTGGVKTLEDSVFAPVSAQDDAVSNPHTENSGPQAPALTPDVTESPPQTPPHARLFPRHAFERPRDPDELATRVINRQRRGSTRVPYPTTPRNHAKINRRPGDVPPTPVASRHTTERCRANAAAAPPHSPSVATNAQPVDHRTRRRTTDSNSLDGTPAEPDSHAKPQQARPHRTPERKHIRAETTEATPAINRANAAVEMFLRRYDAARPTPAPAAAPASRAYDAIAQHLDYRLATDPDTTRVTQPFAMRPGPHAVLLQWKKK